MPELPEVETVRLGLVPVCRDQKIVSCQVNCEKLRFPFNDDFVVALTGSRILDIQRRGKFMIALLSNERALIWHLGMSGRVKIVLPGQLVQIEKHDHVVLALESGAHIIYNDPRRFGFMVLTDGPDWQNSLFFTKMGPEPLGNSFDGTVLKDALKGKSTEIKSALLDQRVVAGIGNIYACEALYMSSISPKKKAGDISAAKCDALAQAIRDVLNKALASGGSSLKDYRKTDGSLGYFQHCFQVYDREGQPCPDSMCTCQEKGGVQRITQGGRSTFYCPVRQK